MNGVGYFEYPFSGTQLVVSMKEIELTDDLNLVSFQPGPAGMSSADIGDGIFVDVDFAEPGRLCAIRLPVDQLRGQHGQLKELIGPEGRDDVGDTIADPPSGADLQIIHLGRSQRVRQRGTLDYFDRSDSASAAGQILTAVHVGDDLHEEPLVRAIARFEVFAAIRRNQNSIISPSQLDSSIGYALAAIEDDLQGRQILTRLNPNQYQQLVDIVRGGVEVHEQYGARISKQIVGLLGDNFTDNGRGIFQQPQGTYRNDPDQVDAVSDTTTNRRDNAASPGSNQPSQPPDQTDDSPPFGEVTGPSSAQSTGSMTAWLSSPGRLEVSFAEKPNDSWIKVFDPNLSLIAAVPIINRGSRSGGWHAQAVIPEQHSADNVNIVVTSNLGTRPGDQFDRIIDAVEAGRSATRLEAAGRTAEASAQWKICAVIWNGLGDTTRSNMALAYARSERQVTQLPQLHDAVRTLI